MKNKKELKQIAAHYGLDAQLIQTVEELSELTLEILALNRYGETADRRSSVAEEIADVEIMLDQIKIIYQIYPKVKEYRAAKIARQLARIAKEKK